MSLFLNWEQNEKAAEWEKKVRGDHLFKFRGQDPAEVQQKKSSSMHDNRDSGLRVTAGRVATKPEKKKVILMKFSVS